MQIYPIDLIANNKIFIYPFIFNFSDSVLGEAQLLS